VTQQEVRKFRKKPIVIEAYQTDSQVKIETLEGTMVASPGDWIITGIQGEQYPCKPDIFEATYELVEGDDEDLVPMRLLCQSALGRTMLDRGDHVSTTELLTEEQS